MSGYGNTGDDAKFKTHGMVYNMCEIKHTTRTFLDALGCRSHYSARSHTDCSCIFCSPFTDTSQAFDYVKVIIVGFTSASETTRSASLQFPLERTSHKVKLYALVLVVLHLNRDRSRSYFGCLAGCSSALCAGPCGGNSNVRSRLANVRIRIFAIVYDRTLVLNFEHSNSEFV